MDVRHVNTGPWIRSSWCGPKNNCVELCHTGTEVIVRDSKNEPATLTFDHACWSAFAQRFRTDPDQGSTH